MRRLAVVAWIAWSILVVQGALASAQIASELPGPMGVIIGRLGQLAFVSIVAATTVAWFAWARLRRGQRPGYWVCLCVSSPLEAAHLVLVLLPGYTVGLPARMEPAFWLAALGATLLSWPDD